MNGESNKPATQADLHAVRTDLRAEIQDLRQDMTTRLDSIEKLLRHVVETLPEKADRAELERLRSRPLRLVIDDDD